MKDLIEGAVEKNRVLLEQKHIELSLHGDEHIELSCDSIWQSEAISNILKNAIEHSYCDGTIGISFKENNFVVSITITDHGAGIKKEKGLYLKCGI